MSVLVAGVGNVFFSDDGFGPQVAQVLAREPELAARVEDYGIRGLHLAYELLNGYDRAILIDAVPRGEPPGTLFVIEPDRDAPHGAPDAHRMDVGNVLSYLALLGGEAPPITLVGCEPETIEPGMGLSPAVERAVDAAAALIRRLIATPGGVACSDR